MESPPDTPGLGRDHSLPPANIPSDAPTTVSNHSPTLLPSKDTPTGGPMGSEDAQLAEWWGLKVLLRVVGSSCDVFPPLKSVVGGLGQCILVFEAGQASKGRKDYDDLRTILNTLLGDLAGFLEKTGSSALSSSAKNLCIGITKELRLIEQRSSRPTFRKYAEASEDAEDIIQCYHRIQLCLERLTLNANLLIWRTVDTQDTETRLRQLMPSMSAVYNSAESEGMQRRSCTPETRKRELRMLLDWSCNKAAGSVCCMNGMAGTGKTTIAYSLCAELEENAKLGASFFCSRQTPECRNVKLIIPAIAYQLARFSEPFRYALSRVLRADPDVHTRVLKNQFESLLIKPLGEIKNTLPEDLVVVIDALDECENEDTVGQILDTLFSEALEPDFPVRFLISSRPETEISLRMTRRTGDGPGARLVLHELDEKTVNQDIETYLCAELDEANFTTDQISDLAKHAGVLFIYASTAARYIRGGIRLTEHEERLNMILGLAPPAADGKDREIDKLYAPILRAAFQKGEFDDSCRKRMKMILDSVICVQEPMTVNGLAGLLDLKNGTLVSALLQPLSSVLNISETGLVSTLHASFPEFMLDPVRATIFVCDSKSRHCQLAKACFEVVGKTRPSFNICGLGSSFVRDDRTRNVEEFVSPELFYSSRYWMTHLKSGGSCEDLCCLLSEFLSIRLLFWMEVLNVKGSMHLGPGIMQCAEAWSRANACSKETIDLAHDAWRFIVMFTGHAVSESTPHIYVSMLPLWPDSSPIAKNYKQKMRGVIEARGTAVDRRQLALLATWTFDGHVTAARLSSDGSLIAFTAEEQSHINVIDGTTGRIVVGPLDHGGNDVAVSVAFSPNGALIASGSQYGSIKVWNVQNGQEFATLSSGYSPAIRSVCFSHDGMRIASGSGSTIRIWELNGGCTVIDPLEGHTSSIRSVHFSPDGNYIASCSDKTLRVWGARNGLAFLEPITHPSIIMSLCFSPDSTRIITGSRDSLVRVWDVANGRMAITPLGGHFDGVLCVGISSEGKHIASGSRDCTIRLWEVDGLLVSVRVLEGHTNSVTSVMFSPEGTRIISASLDNTIRVWDAQGLPMTSTLLEGHTDPIISVGFSPNGAHIASGAHGVIQVWDAQTGRTVGEPFRGHTNWVPSVCFSPDGRRIASCSDDIQVWDMESGDLVSGPFTGHTDTVSCVCFSPDGTLIASGSRDDNLGLWDLQGGQGDEIMLEGHDDSVLSVRFSPDGAYIVSSSSDKTIRVWNVGSRQTIIGPLGGQNGDINVACFSPDGTRIVSGSEDGTLQIWDIQTEEMAYPPLEGHTASVQSICFSRCGTIIVSCSADSSLRLWDARNGQMVGRPLLGHTGLIRSIAPSPSGRYVASVAHDKTIRLWDISEWIDARVPRGQLPPCNLVPDNSSSPKPWDLGEDGWVVDSQSNLLVWVPPDLHAALLCRHTKLIITSKGSFELDFESAELGELWTKCYEPESP